MVEDDGHGVDAAAPVRTEPQGSWPLAGDRSSLPRDSTFWSVIPPDKSSHCTTVFSPMVRTFWKKLVRSILISLLVPCIP